MTQVIASAGQISKQLKEFLPSSTVGNIMNKITTDNISTVNGQGINVATKYTKNVQVYGGGERCLMLDPFDNYRMFTLYDNALSSDRKPLDISDGAQYYLIFRSGSKEIKIPEYVDENMSFSVDKTNGQLLFKIAQKQAIDILSMTNHLFYITRIYELYNPSTDSIVSSDEQAVYSGLWGDKSKDIETNYISKIEELQKEIESLRNNNNTAVLNTSTMIGSNINMAAALDALNTELIQLRKESADLTSQVQAYKQVLTQNNIDPETGSIKEDSVLQGEIMDSNTLYVQYTGTNQEGFDAAVKSFQNFNIENI